MNPSEGVEREARRIADCRKISDEHGERIYKDVLDALTQAEKRGFERKQETLEAENKRLREALRYIYDNCDSEQEKWAEQTAKEALGGEV